jgi:hypothetical protein
MSRYIDGDVYTEEEYEDDPYEYEGDDKYDRCGCRFCFCMTETEYGVTCGDCATGAHQG